MKKALVFIICAAAACGCMTEEKRKAALEKCRNDQWFEISQTFPLAMKSQGLEPEDYPAITSAFGTKNFAQMRQMAQEKGIFLKVMRAYDIAFELGAKKIDCSEFEAKK